MFKLTYWVPSSNIHNQILHRLLYTVLKILTLPTFTIYLHKHSSMSSRVGLNSKPSSDRMCPTLSFLCVRPLRPSREQTAYIWTQFTPPAWPIFCLPLFFLPTSVEVFSLSRPTGSWVTIPSQSLFYGNRIQYTSQLYYKNVWFSSFLKLSFYHLWPCCLRYINSNLEKK